MNTTHRAARIAAALLASLVSWAIAAPFAFAATASGPGKAKAHTAQMHWYRWHPTARLLHKHYGSKVVIGVASMLDFKSLRVEYGFGLGAARELPGLHAVLAKVSDAQLDALLTRGTQDPRIRYVSPISKKRNVLNVPNDPYISTVDGTTNMPFQWPFLATHVDRALEFTTGDPRVVVGVIDTGVARVPDLRGKIDSLWSVTDGAVVQVFEDNDDDGHGTAVTALIAANANDRFGIAGFGGDTHVIGVHAGIEGWFSDADIAIGLNKLVSLGVRVVNMSLGSKYRSDPLLIDAIHSAAAQNVLLVAAAGNSDTEVFWPAAELQRSGGGRSFGLAVGATDGTGGRAGFSNWGERLSIMAPGTFSKSTGLVVALPPVSPIGDLVTTWKGDGNAHYGYVGGTSFASPEVAGVAALVWAANPELTNYQVADILKQSASRTSADWTPEMGCGLLDAGAALELATSRTASELAATQTASGASCSAFGNAPAIWPASKSQVIEFANIANKRVGDKDFRLKASVTSGLPLTLTIAGPCSFKGTKVHVKGVGFCLITASQEGTEEYLPAESVTKAFHIAKAKRPGHKV